ncbi:MAG TPA: PTS sugar transporter subunit IIA [Planctomycetota bacterium]|nr:PTS sugar transporter subunit IIA [Planctomycetota bacterium]
MNFRRFLSPASIRLEMRTTALPEGEAPEDFDTTSQQNLTRVREGVIEEMTELLAATGEVPSPHRLYRDLLNREKKAVTAVGLGVAIPHVRTLQARSFLMAFGRSSEGLPFQAPDGEPVHLFFAMAAPPHDDRTYLKIYRALAKLLLDPENHEQFRSAREPSQILRALELVQ